MNEISPDKFKKLGKAVIETEQSALAELIDRIDEKFNPLVKVVT